MKKILFKIFTPILFAALIIGCDNNSKTEENTSDKDTVVVVQEPAEAPVEETTPAPAPEPKVETKTETKTEITTTEAAKPDWRTMLKEYHEILCKNHKGQGTTDDKIRQAELLREITIEGKKLKSGEKFSFTTEMARAVNMETCN